jgi:hypothetical protein
VGDLRIVDLYVVNGEKVGSQKFEYKLRWLAAVREWLRAELQQHPNMIVLGDFNIAPDDRDVHDPKRWREKILCSTPEREALRSLLDLGLHDSFRLFNDEAGHFSWWDYRLAAFQRGWGLRIDLVLVSDALKARARQASTPRRAGWNARATTRRCGCRSTDHKKPGRGRVFRASWSGASCCSASFLRSRVIHDRAPHPDSCALLSARVRGGRD